MYDDFRRPPSQAAQSYSLKYSKVPDSLTAVDIELLVVLALLVAMVLILTYYRRMVRSLETKLGTRQTGAYNIGAQQVKGDFAQILGTFGVLGEYEELVFLSTTTKQASLDLLGVKLDSIDFIELKK